MLTLYNERVYNKKKLQHKQNNFIRNKNYDKKCFENANRQEICWCQNHIAWNFLKALCTQKHLFLEIFHYNFTFFAWTYINTKELDIIRDEFGGYIIISLFDNFLPHEIFENEL